MAGTLPSTTDATFADDVLASATPVLVDFTADWCPPCKMIAPVLAQIAAENADRLRVVALDVDDNPQTTQRYNVLGMPTLALFVRGELVTTVVGERRIGGAGEGAGHQELLLDEDYRLISATSRSRGPASSPHSHTSRAVTLPPQPPCR